MKSEKLHKVIIAGGREFDSYPLLIIKCNKILKGLDNVEIVSGKARGADRLGELYAARRGFKVKEFPAKWDGEGRVAGIIRNKEMAKYADYLIAFWDGKSKGTKHMIEEAKDRGLKVRVIKYGI